MDQELDQRLEQLSQKIIDVADQVTKVADAEVQRPPEIRQANSAVDKVVAEYRTLLNSVPEKEQMKVERNVGRRVTDLRRLASRLPALRHTHKSVPTVKDDPFGNWLPPPEEHDESDESVDPDEILAKLPPPPKPRAAIRVTGDIDAWCGPCGGLREHTIVAMVGDEPKQVICQSCGARHGYRTTPARGKTSSAKPASTNRRQSSAAQAASLKKEQERMALQKELVEAEEVRTFERRARYKRGEIIEHPEFGRGKIENVLKGSLLVRFRSGLKAVSTL